MSRTICIACATFVRQARSPLTAILSVVVLTGCGTTPSPDSIPVQFLAVPAVGGSFTLNLDGHTYTSPNLQTVVLGPGSYEVSGTVTGGAVGTQLVVGFTGGGTASGQGGVKSGSIVSLTGPTPVISSCGIGYFAETTGPHQYRFRIIVTTKAGEAC